MAEKDFDFKNLPEECSDSSLKKEDFKLVNTDGIIQDQKFETKPTTFLKDCFRRFKKNKSSVVAAIILGILLVLSVLIPVVDTSDISTPHPKESYLTPKLFDAGTGFWDGTKKWNNIPVDTGANGFNETDKDANWWPNPERFKANAVSKKKFSDVTFTSGESKYGKEGYVHFGYYYNIPKEEEFVEFKTRPITARVKKVDYKTLNLSNPNDKIYLTSFDTYDLNKLKLLEGDKNGVTLPDNYVLAPVSFNFTYEHEVENEHGEIEFKTETIEILPAEREDEKTTYSIGSKISSLDEEKIELAEIIREKSLELTEAEKDPKDRFYFYNACFSVRLANQNNRKNTCALIRSISFDAQLSDDKFNEAVEIVNFNDHDPVRKEGEPITDATECVLRTINEPGTSVKNRSYWISTGVKNVHMSKIVYCSFVYDSYEAAFGVMEFLSFPITYLEEYAKPDKKWIIWDVESEDTPGVPNSYHLIPGSRWEILDKENSPIVEFIGEPHVDPKTGKITVDAMVSYYKFYGYKKMPRYLMGTDKSGYDMLKYAFVGLRSSLLLGILTFVICFSFGLLYGSVSGYFGGIVDLALERVTDILAGVPWVVVMTLVIIKAGSSSFGVLLLALCLTGWIGTAATTRTQFYRFRGREYVLASRTLGASDARLIAKHILPNAMGTIITGAVLMIPSVIFSEATLSYLGLLRTIDGVISLGVTLSNNQGELTTNSYLLIFPSVIIALLMISFNLFGNGLRDAVNPSLKGEDE